MLSLIEKALKISLEAHRGQKDRYGAPYILHPLRVMMRMQGEKEQTVALLHDVIEDSSWTADSLREAGFEPLIVSSVEALSKKPGEDYMKYVGRTTLNSITIKVKLADLADNMDLSRCPKVTSKDMERFNRYLEATNFLKTYLQKLEPDKNN